MPILLNSQRDPRPNMPLPNKGINRSLALGRILHFEALMRRRLGEVRAQRYVRLHNYYVGQNLPPDNVQQPLLINYFKQIVDKHTNYLWGQWKERLVTFRVTPIAKDDLEGDELEAAIAYGRLIKRFLDRWYVLNKLNTVFWDASKNGSLYGDSVLKPRYDPIIRHVKVDSVLPEYFHCIWDISNMEDLQEVIVAYPIDRLAAKEKYGNAGNEQMLGYQEINPTYLPGIGIYWERWSQTSFQIWIDDQQAYNYENPYMPYDLAGNAYPGLLPFIHIPCMRGGSEYFGYSMAESILFLQDELNRKLADAGDIVDAHAHPTVLLRKFTGDQTDLPVGPDAVWDMGREGEAEVLEGKGPPPEVMTYIETIKETMFETASMPKSAFGTQKGGTSHQSGLALAMAMMPVVERAKEWRIRWSEGLKRLVMMMFFILDIRDPSVLKMAGLDLTGILQYEITPVFADILPKDRLELVNESVARSANMLQSIPSALEALGEDDVQTEYSRILQDAQQKAALAAPTPGAGGGTAGKNGEEGQGGAAGIPGAIGADAGKPGVLIKSNLITNANQDSVSLDNTP